MAATVAVNFSDPASPGDPNQDAVRNAIAIAFSEWVRHFDTTAGAYTINVTFQGGLARDVALFGDSYVQVGSASGVPLLETAFGLGFAARNGTAATAPALTLYVNPFNFMNTGLATNIVAPLEREFEHALGVRSFRGTALFLQPIPIGSRTVYDGSIQGNEQYFRAPATQPLTFFGPNAYVAYGGPVPLGNTDASFTTVGGGVAVNTYVQGAATVQPLDVALLRDAGLPALTDQELGEHQVARLYVAAFGRAADSAGLILYYDALRSGRSLAQIAADFTSSAEYANRYGNLSNADFVNALYQNVLSRPGDAAGVQNFVAVLDAGNSRSALLTGFADSDEARSNLSGNPNVIYAATAEAQVARMYDTAFGRNADPAGFNLFTRAVINGTSLQQVALSFLSSPEFANRYGASPSNQALVDGLYQNTLQRAPDAAGEALFIQALASGLSRADLLASFSNSQEHVNLVAQRAGARDASGLSLDTTPHLGIIPVISGLGAA